MDKKYLTTTQAAKLLSVSSDTVLKWVRAGKLASYRTPGGHCRIPSNAVDGLLPENTVGQQQMLPSPEVPPIQYCWEYNSATGELNEDCRDCIVYQSRARRCYEFRDVPEEFGYLRLHCKSTCDECDYYQVVKEQGVNVLLITRSTTLIDRLNDQDTGDRFHLRFATSEYETSATIEGFRPDYVVVDCSLGIRKAKNICDHLVADSRIPVTRLILASKDERATRDCGHEIMGWLRKPFNIQHLREFIATIQSPAHSVQQKKNI